MTTTRTILNTTRETRRKRYIGRYPAIALGLDTEADSVCSLIVPISGAPSELELTFPEKTIYVNRDGDASTTIYVNIGGVAVALPLSGGAGSINGGTIDAAVIGATTPAAGTFTTLAATTVLTDEVVKAAIAVANASGGATTAALTVALTRANGSTAIASARQVLIKTGAAQYAPQALNGNVTFGSATVGSIIASGTGWALIETTAGGLFACTATNASDESVYFWCESSFRASDLTKAATVIGSNSDVATWAA